MCVDRGKWWKATRLHGALLLHLRQRVEVGERLLRDLRDVRDRGAFEGDHQRQRVRARREERRAVRLAHVAQQQQRHSLRVGLAVPRAVRKCHDRGAARELLEQRGGDAREEVERAQSVVLRVRVPAFHHVQQARHHLQAQLLCNLRAAA